MTYRTFHRLLREGSVYSARCERSMSTKQSIKISPDRSVRPEDYPILGMEGDLNVLADR